MNGFGSWDVWAVRAASTAAGLMQEMVRAYEQTLAMPKHLYATTTHTIPDMRITNFKKSDAEIKSQNVLSINSTLLRLDPYVSFISSAINPNNLQRL